MLWERGVFRVQWMGLILCGLSRDLFNETKSTQALWNPQATNGTQQYNKQRRTMNLKISGYYHAVLFPSSCGASLWSSCYARETLLSCVLLEVVFIGSKFEECSWMVAHWHRGCSRRTVSQHTTGFLLTVLFTVAKWRNQLRYLSTDNQTYRMQF